MKKKAINLLSIGALMFFVGYLVKVIPDVISNVATWAENISCVGATCATLGLIALSVIESIEEKKRL
jgi:hypothetical protein